MSGRVPDSISRRKVLGLTGAAFGSVALDAAAAQRAGTVRLNVGYSAPSGKRAATSVADEVVYEFGFDAVTILAPAGARERLAARTDVRYAERDGEIRAIGLDGILPPGILGGTSDGSGRGRGRGGDDDRDDGGDGGDDNRPDGGGEGNDSGDGDDSDDGSGDGGSDDGGSGDSGNSSEGGSGDSTCSTGDQPYTWGIDRSDADVAHRKCDRGEGAHVAIIDTGIDRFHSDVEPNVGEGVGFIAGVRTSNWQDDNGHGTHVAGIAAARDSDRGVVGIGPAATLHAVKVIQSPGVGLISDVARGIEWTADQGYDVGNLSLGGGDTELLREACADAVRRGVLLVAAAGNAGPCTDCVYSPASYDTVMAVSATSCGGSLADFSSTGPEVEIAAPGEAIYSTFTGSTPVTNMYATLSGTSMASPHVAGAGAQLMANGYDNDEARSRLASTAESLGIESTAQGAGLLDVAAALGYDSSDDGTGNGPNC